MNKTKKRKTKHNSKTKHKKQQQRNPLNNSVCHAVLKMQTLQRVLTRILAEVCHAVLKLQTLQRVLIRIFVYRVAKLKLQIRAAELKLLMRELLLMRQLSC